MDQCFVRYSAVAQLSNELISLTCEVDDFSAKPARPTRSHCFHLFLTPPKSHVESLPRILIRIVFSLDKWSNLRPGYALKPDHYNLSVTSGTTEIYTRIAT